MTGGQADVTKVFDELDDAMKEHDRLIFDQFLTRDQIIRIEALKVAQRIGGCNTFVTLGAAQELEEYIKNGTIKI